jgi:hypothetical protein
MEQVLAGMLDSITLVPGILLWPAQRRQVIFADSNMIHQSMAHVAGNQQACQCDRPTAM